MAQGFNKCILIGNIVQQPELKATTSGNTVCSFSIAINKKLKNGEKVTYANIETWDKTAEFVARYFTKGKPILIVGEYAVSVKSDDNGKKSYFSKFIANEVYFVGGKNDNTEAPAETSQGGGNYVTPSGSGNGFAEVDIGDDIPF